MNIELINEQDADINDVFEMPDTLIETVIENIKENLNSICNTNKNVTKKTNNFTYNSFKINDYPDDCISVQIHGIYQRGIIIRIIAASNPGFYKYDTITSGLLILNENKRPIFVIEELDGRIERNRLITKTKETTLIIKTNQQKIALEIKELGKRIDKKYVGKFKKNIFQNDKIQQQKMNMLKLKFELLILKHLEKLEQVKKEKIALPKALKKKI